MNENKYIEAMKAIEISPEVKHRILAKIIKTKQNKESYIMMSKKKALFIAAAIMILGVTAFAANGLISSWFSSSSGIPDYNSLPTIEKAQKDAGYAPVLIEKFDNGYVFDNGNIVDNNLADANNNSVEKFKSFSFRYTKDGDTVILLQGKYTSEMPEGGTLISSENGNDIYFTGYTNKIVPPDYKLTEEDKNAEKNGELVFSYGSSEVIISEIMGVCWSIEDMHFNLMQIDGRLSSDDLVKMANYIISQNFANYLMRHI